MVANGATNVPEGMAWGWRVLSHGEPFTDGRPESERGNTKVLIVLTDGANTYYTPSSLGFNDSAGNKSIYSNLGYVGKTTPGYSTSRIFQGTSVRHDHLLERQLHQGDEPTIRHALRQRQGCRPGRHHDLARSRRDKAGRESADGRDERVRIQVGLYQGR